MAEVKIGQFPTGEPVTGEDLIPASQNGVTGIVKVKDIRNIGLTIEEGGAEKTASNENLKTVNAKVDTLSQSVDTSFQTVNQNFVNVENEIESANNAITAANQNVTNHEEDSSIHVTPEKTTEWNKNTTDIVNINTDLSDMEQQVIDINKSATEETSKIYRTLDKLKNKQQVKIVCYGDSLTWGYKPSIGTQVVNPYPLVLQTKLRELFGYNDITVVNEGHTGWQSDEALANISNVTTQAPDLCIVMFGTNDLTGSTLGTITPISTFNSNMIGVVKELKDNNIDVILSTPPPNATGDRSKLKFYNDTIKEIALNYNIKLVDVYENIKTLWEKKFIIPSTLLPDGTHFADDYYKYLAHEFVRAFFYFRVAKNGVSIPMVNNPDCLTDCTNVNSSAGQYYYKNYGLPSLASSGHNGTYIKIPFWVDNNNVSVSLVYPTAPNGVSDGGVRINGVVAKTVNFNTAGNTYDNKVIIKSNLDYGLNILEINYADSAQANIFYCTAIAFDEVDDTGWITASLINGWTGTLMYKKKSDVVIIRLYRLTKTTADSNPCFILPNGFMPEQSMIYTIVTETGSLQRAVITTAGNILIQNYDGSYHKINEYYDQVLNF